MLQLASGKSVPVMMNCAALSDPEKTKSLRLPILRGEIGGREVDVVRRCRGSETTGRRRSTDWRTKDKVLSNFYWPGVDGDVTRYCRSCDVCQRTVKKGIVLRVPLEKAQGRQRHYYDRTAKCRKFSVGEKVLVLLPTDSNIVLMQWKGPFKVVATVVVNDYRINMCGKVKTFHANLLKKYIARDQDIHQAAVDEGPLTSSSAISAAKFDPCVKKDTIAKKINNIRAASSRELNNNYNNNNNNNNNKPKQSSAGSDDVYEP
ncbi:zinc finger protein [Elysia marginata]|uniref:Zinc finger protein n=1 Tax=Elysia marginata TaxID=1093978 RepID=A0AAV4H997_9GAST|nr:zinc finger protein [Elysia marginata]